MTLRIPSPINLPVATNLEHQTADPSFMATVSQLPFHPLKITPPGSHVGIPLCLREGIPRLPSSRSLHWFPGNTATASVVPFHPPRHPRSTFSPSSAPTAGGKVGAALRQRSRLQLCSPPLPQFSRFLVLPVTHLHTCTIPIYCS